MSNSFRVKNNILHINVNGNITYKEQKSILNKLLDNITKIKDMVVIMDYKDALLNFEIREADRICRFITMKNEFRRNIQQLIFIPG
ncbi:MAG: hypothetical protein HOH19_11130, partial [Kordiimonadaceae bacterium]|nr:hypothetical protein [Kordiimonadaceae bacterium]